MIQRYVDACSGCTPANYLLAAYGAVSNNNLINPADAGTPPPNDIGDGSYWYTSQGAGSYTDYDYVKIASLGVPKPGTFGVVCFGSLLAVLGAAVRRRRRKTAVSSPTPSRP